MQLDKSLEFINSALEKESEDIPNVSFGVEEVQEDKTEDKVTKVSNVTSVATDVETKEEKLIEKEVIEEKSEKLKKPEEQKKDEHEMHTLLENDKEKQARDDYVYSSTHSN